MRSPGNTQEKILAGVVASTKIQAHHDAAHGLRQRGGNGVSTTGWSVTLAMPTITVVMMIPALTMILASMMTPIIMIVIRNDAATQTNYDQACD
jgi:hypothetical protein